MMEKPTQATVDAFEAAFPDDPRASRRQMFGMACGVVNGNLFAGVYEQGVTLRLGQARVAELMAKQPDVGVFMPGGRKWPEYAIALAETWTGTDELTAWVAEALEHTSGLPPKDSLPKPKKTKRR